MPVTASSDPPVRRVDLARRLPRYRTGDDDLDAAIADIVSANSDGVDSNLISEMIVSAMLLARDRADRGDLKIANAALKELRYAFAMFTPYRATRKAAIFGSARTKRDDPLYAQTHRLARDLAEADWMVITGAGPGIMEAGIEGAGVDSSFGVGIQLPFEAGLTPFLADDPKMIEFRYFFTRKLNFVKESDGFVLLPGGFGTLDEAFELLTLVQTGKAPIAPIVLLDVPGGTYWQSWRHFVDSELGRRGYISQHDLDLVTITDNAEIALTELTRFYTRYHSQRYVDGNLVLRCSSEISPELVVRLNDEFHDIVASGRIEPSRASRAERRDNDHVDLQRLRFRFDRRSYARLRQMVDVINESPAT